MRSKQLMIKNDIASEKLIKYLVIYLVSSVTILIFVLWFKIANADLFSRNFCSSAECIETFFSALKGMPELIEFLIKALVSWVTVYVVYHALRHYLNSISTSRSNLYLMHLNTFNTFLSSEIENYSRLDIKSFDVFKWYNLAYPEARFGVLEVGTDYKDFISSLNKEHLAINSKYRDIQESLEVNVDIDSKKIYDLYSALNSEFSLFIKKSLDEVISFRREISSNRSKFLIEREAQYKNRLNKIRDNVVALEGERARLYKMLDERSAFDAIKSAYSILLEEKSELSGKQAYISQLDYIEDEIADKKSGAGKIVADIVKSKGDSSEILESIKNTFLDNQIHIAHNVKIGANSIIAGQVGIAGSSIIGSNVRIGGQAGISGHLKIGNNVKIGGASGVTRDIPDNSQVMGYPAVPLRDFVKMRKKNEK